ncbi:hypothetical protein LTR53_012783 [Teratosphaeriaceae sp. CCFEE 6253]|nr:hypothetical protein LTR53_012783 [Teratosphaeriaceae sp. CCFEE 6253]
MSSWSDRRGLTQKGKEVIAPPTEGRQFGTGVLETVRRASITSENGLEKTLSNTSSGGPPSPPGQRRRSSNAGKFANLQTHKRGSEDYVDRRMSHGEHAPTGGVLSGWYNSTFRGYQKPEEKAPAAVKQMPQALQKGGQKEHPVPDFTD